MKMLGPPTWAKFKYIKKPRKNKHQQGSYELSEIVEAGWWYTYFRKLPPIEEMAGIVLENEDIIDLALVPDATCKTEK